MFYRTLAPMLVLAAVATGCGDSSAADPPAQPQTSAPLTTTTIGSPTTVSGPGSSTPSPGFPVTVAGANGETELPERPSRIVSMSATHTEMLFAIGAGNQVIAVDAFSNYPPEAPATELTGFSPNIEAIIEYGADLVVTDGDWDGTSMGTLAALGVPVLILPAAMSLDEVYRDIATLGIATGHVDEAAALLSGMRSEVNRILDNLPDRTEQPTFYHELDTTYYSITSDTFIGQLYSLLGLENIADAAGGESAGYPQLSEEYILQQDPDIIFLADTICCEVSVESLAERPGWDTLTAVRTGSVVELNDDVSSRWGPRIVEHLKTVADAISGMAAD